MKTHWSELRGGVAPQALAWIVGMGWLLIIAAAPALADEETSSTTTQPLEKVERAVVTREGIRFNVPPDWPIEQQGSAVGPIAVEDYVVRKFKVMEARLAADAMRIEALEHRVRDLEQSMHERDGKRRAAPAANPALNKTMKSDSTHTVPPDAAGASTPTAAPATAEPTAPPTH